MTEDRLKGLERIHINKVKEIDRVQVLDKFDASGNRRLGVLHL